MRVAVVGTGIAGLVAARALHGKHDLTVFEAADWIGGHTHTVEIETESGPVVVDTGFIVFNRKTYPKFCALLGELGIEAQASEMSFSVRCERTGLEYNGTSLDGLLAQRTNALRPSFWRMVRDILRFYREAPTVLEREAPSSLGREAPSSSGRQAPGVFGDRESDLTLGEFLERGRYSLEFIEQHILPMGAAVWSARRERMLEFPMRFLVQFFHNHGFLQVDGRPQWLVVRGGSSAYVQKLVQPFRERIRMNTPVVRIERTFRGVLVRTASGEEEVFDHVVLASHADQSLRMLADATALEREVLGSFAYQRNEVVLHTDTSLMPRKRSAWASWNYHVTHPTSDLPTVTYWMNRLQTLPGDTQYLLTLNRSGDIDPKKVLRRFVYHHPIYSVEAVRAQARQTEIDDAGGVHFCGAYWGYGFHEDGVKSALSVVSRIGRKVLAR